MSLSPVQARRIAVRTVVATVSGMGWCLAVVSGLSTFDGVWRFIGAAQSSLVDAGLAGRQHCWLCGMSRAFRALWQGRPEAALLYNPNSPALFSLMLVLCASPAILWALRKAKTRISKLRSPAS